MVENEAELTFLQGFVVASSSYPRSSLNFTTGVAVSDDPSLQKWREHSLDVPVRFSLWTFLPVLSSPSRWIISLPNIGRFTLFSFFVFVFIKARVFLCLPKAPNSAVNDQFRLALSPRGHHFHGTWVAPIEASLERRKYLNYSGKTLEMTSSSYRCWRWIYRLLYVAGCSSAVEFS